MADNKQSTQTSKSSQSMCNKFDIQNELNNNTSQTSALSVSTILNENKKFLNFQVFLDN